MQQGWIEWAQVCKLMILHDTAPVVGSFNHNFVLCGALLWEGILISKEIMPTFHLCFLTESKWLLLLPNSCHAQDHPSIACGWLSSSLYLCPSDRFLSFSSPPRLEFLLFIYLSLGFLSFSKTNCIVWEVCLHIVPTCRLSKWIFHLTSFNSNKVFGK